MKGKRSRPRTTVLVALALVAGLGATVPAHADDPAYPFRDPGLPVEARVSDLLSRLTLDEKISLLHGATGPAGPQGAAGLTGDTGPAGSGSSPSDSGAPSDSGSFWMIMSTLMLASARGTKIEAAMPGLSAMSRSVIWASSRE